MSHRDIWGLVELSQDHRHEPNIVHIFFISLNFLINDRYLFTKQIKDCPKVAKIFPKQSVVVLQLTASHDYKYDWLRLRFVYDLLIFQYKTTHYNNYILQSRVHKYSAKLSALRFRCSLVHLNVKNREIPRKSILIIQNTYT